MTPYPDDPLAPEEEVEPQPPVAHVRIVYLGPVAPHWEVRSDFGDAALVEEFRRRTMARLVLLPPHDPQYRRNRERVIRDAERENILLEWDLGIPEEEEAAPAEAAAAAVTAAGEGPAAPAEAAAAAVTAAGEGPAAPAAG